MKGLAAAALQAKKKRAMNAVLFNVRNQGC
jgi:hypothetical protein